MCGLGLSPSLLFFRRKEIIMELKNKLFIILISVLILLTVFLTNISFASNSLVYDFQEVNLKQFENSKAFLLYDKTNKKFVYLDLFLSSHGACFDSAKYYVSYENDDTIGLHGCCAHGSFDCFAMYNYDITSGTVTSLIDSQNTASNGYPISKSQYSFVYTNGKIYKNNQYSDLTESSFFLVPPLGVQLVDPMKVEEIPEMIRKILIILVPVGLIIFGMLLAPFLIKYRNSQIQ